MNAERIGLDKDGRSTAGANRVAVKLPLLVACVVVKCPVSRVIATTALCGVTEPAKPFSVTSPVTVGEEILIKAALGGSSGTNGAWLLTYRQHQIRHHLPINLKPESGLDGMGSAGEP